jgi:SAM-dependent methyltransferase
MEFSFEDFKKRALDKDLSKWEKIGFPNSYRAGEIENHIFLDISTKLDLKNCKKILDIGSGCSDLVIKLINYSTKNNVELYLNDSNEMLENIPKEIVSSGINFIPGMFPNEVNFSKDSLNTFDAIIVYSVIQYVFNYQSIYQFIHECIKFLKPGGRLLIGDVPNFNCRERFLNSSESSEFKNNKVSVSVDIVHENIDRLDDSIVMSILLRFRNFGCETYVLPQPKSLPFANRREDILIVKR